MAERRNVTMLEVIHRIPSLCKAIIDNSARDIVLFAKENKETLKSINQIYLVASGSSLTAANTAAKNLELHTLKSVRCISSNEFINDTHVYPEDALYIFVSQTGGSVSTRAGLKRVQDKGALCLSLSERHDSHLAQESHMHMEIGCGLEEYGQRTIGYTTSVLKLTLIGIEIGRVLGHLSGATCEQLYARAYQAIERHSDVVDDVYSWFDYRKRDMLFAQTIVFVASGDLKGLAQESGVKIWETPQIPSYGYEIEEAMHGINYGMKQRYCVVVYEGLDGHKTMTQNFVTWLDEVHDNVYYFGSDANPNHPKHFKINTQDSVFRFIEYSAAIQVMNYRLANDSGRDLMEINTHAVMNQYFKMHEK